MPVEHENTKTGHRQRLREKFGRSGIGAFHDYEIIEMLLMLGTTRIDCKPQAKRALKEFGNLRGVLQASTEELEKVKGITPYSIFVIKFVKELAKNFLREQVIDGSAYKSSRDVLEYLSLSMRDLRQEVFKVMFLNSQNRLIHDEDLFEGTLGASVVYPRKVVEKAIKYNAAALIFVHNHPSGDPSPSDSDKQTTRDLVFVANAMQMRILDHIIVGNNHDRYFSFADNGLIEQYNSRFVALMRE
jgi:DNA repair protein RadC